MNCVSELERLIVEQQRDAGRASASPTAENLDRVQQATKTLRAGAPRRTRLEQDAAQALRALEVATQDFQRSLSEAA